MSGERETITLTRVGRHEGAPMLARGEVLGRYVILRALGSGGMGVVYVAYDADLERNVALKLLRSGPEPSTTARQTRLLDEAKALAKLSHPNVVPVFDAGLHGEHVYFVMELVRGKTLAGWLRSARRTRHAILEQFHAAGRGLAAIHRAGLVHRDIKPSNMILGGDGRLRIVDLGLASATATREAAAESAPSRRDSGQPASARGPGTPAYMAPEMASGRDADARADQYSLCVSLYEALTGNLPDRDGARAAIDADLSAARVPRWLRRIVRRGLDPDPAARFPSIDRLLAALAQRPRRTRWTLAAALTVVLAVGGYAAIEQRTSLADSLCKGGTSRLEGIWDPPRRRALLTAWENAATPAGAATGRAVARQLDRYRDRWLAMHQEVCEATRIRGEQSEDLMDLRMACLDDRRFALAATADLLTEPDPAIERHALRAVTELPDTGPCANLRALVAMAPRPRDAASLAAAERSSAAVARSQALERVGRLAAAVPPAEEAFAVAEAVEDPTLQARARLRLAEARGRVGDIEALRTGLFAALEAAQRGHADREAAQIWLDLVITEWFAGRFEAAERYATVAAATLERLGGDDELEQRLHNRLGMIANRQNRWAEAVPHFERARAAYARTNGVDTLFLAPATNNLAIAYRGLGRYRQAEAIYREILDGFEAKFGQVHPTRAAVFRNLTSVYDALGDPARAAAVARQGFELTEQIYPQGHSKIAEHALGFGAALLENDEPRAALPHLELAYEFFTADEEGDPIHDASAAFALARASAALGAPPARWRALVQEARDGYRALGQRTAPQAADLEQWWRESDAR